jgi:copper resistance protein D
VSLRHAIPGGHCARHVYDAAHVLQALYTISVWLHIVAAATWLGGMLFLSLVLVPTLTGHPQRGALILLAARRFRAVGWVALAVLLLTGLINLHHRGLLSSQLFDAGFLTSSYGSTVALKLFFVALALFLSVVHDFFIGPRAARAMKQAPDAPSTRQLRLLASLMGRANLVLALIIVAFAVTLVRGPLF